MSVLATRLTALALLAFALVWIVGAFRFIPEGFGGAAISPRGFPVGLGILLALLSLGLIASSFVKGAQIEGVVPHAVRERASEAWAVASTFGFLVVYVFALDLVGFVIATIVAVAAMLYFVLRSRSPIVLIGLPVGLTLGIWLVMGKLMGVYLPHGTLVHGI